ncbi:hypothetical protein J5N97_019232 [Dioscorea zingiberensis]|uniref:Histone deacetylase n=1 Tax=Dioscorea zingiberensis TaxID=325984 RepID=A0A9D5CEJ5_9LILI|nr:hypothetical protein J5N97_019232 [Dioscorea zingiberensis]
MDSGGNSLPSGADGRKRRVTYHYDQQIGNYYYGYKHSMKPHRIRMTHKLLDAYNLLPKMQVFQPRMATIEDLTKFHTDDYIDFLKSITPKMAEKLSDKCKKFNLSTGGDCPVFDGLYSFCSSYAGGSLSSAARLNKGSCDIAINWSGGLHHAKSSCASGFCYVNDIVLAILELLKHHQRVLYVDIDVHHGDGVEEAFYTTNRVMTVSFHQQNIFPETGDIRNIGDLAGKNYAVNVPLQEGITDENYQFMFKPIIKKVMEVYQPEAVVLQCGADSLADDRLGRFNLTIKGHGECVKFLRSFNVPLLLLGGGGYTLRNVARCWCYETAVALDEELDNDLPENDYYDYYGPTYTLHAPPQVWEIRDNKNSICDLHNIKRTVLQNLSNLEHAPSVQFQERPPNADPGEELEDMFE